MFNIGFSELIVIGIVALLVIGPKQLPEVARVVARLIGEFKKATQELSGGLLEVTRDVKSSIEETRDEIVNEGRKIIDETMAASEEDNFDFDEEEEEESDSSNPEELHGKS